MALSSTQGYGNRHNIPVSQLKEVKKPSIVVTLDDVLTNSLFPGTTFQNYVDRAFEETYGVPNRLNGSGDRVVKAEKDKTQGVFAAGGGIVYLHKFTQQYIDVWYEELSKSYKTEFETSTDKDGRIIIKSLGPSEKTILQRIRRDSKVPLAHELQHLSYEILSQDQKDQVIAEVKKRVQKFDWYRGIIKSKYNTSGKELDDDTVNELLCETRKMMHMKFSDTTVGYFPCTPDTFNELQHLVPIVLEISKNYANNKRIPFKREMFTVEHYYPKGARTVKLDGTGKRFRITDLAELEPFKLKNRKIKI